MFHFDPMYLLFLAPGMLLSMWASFKVKSTFKKYSQVASSSGFTGAQVAQRLLDARGIRDVRVEPVGGFLSDHYDPRGRVLRLSPDVHDGRSLAAFGVAAHEAGHAIQHAHGYGPLAFRSAVVKPAMIGSNLGGILCAVGLAMSSASGGANWVLWAGIVLFSFFVVFTLVTLPVEFNASSRALEALQSMGIVTATEAGPTRAVLNAAAMTYVAAAISAIMQLLYFLMRAGLLRGGDDD